LTFTAGGALALTVRGPTAGAAGAVADNLVLKASRALAERLPGLELGRFVLSKRLPVAAGLGGGSADAAAALRLLARVNALAGDDPRLMAAARLTGADVPVCLDPRPRVMRGIGELLSPPLDLPALPALLVNPGVPVPTKDVIARLGLAPGERRGEAGEIDAVRLKDRDVLIAYVKSQPNDLEAPALTLQPVIADVLAALSRQSGCLIARMSGSGATCFGVFASNGAAAAAQQKLQAAHPAWWIAPTVFGG
jgi:4-diphosphocytidyl-2-C-methyl-D-erythritol kinase